MDVEMSQLPVALVDLEIGEAGTLAHISLPPAEQQFLMRIALFRERWSDSPAARLLGDPSVYSVDGTEIALRAETASLIFVQQHSVQQQPSRSGDLS